MMKKKMRLDRYLVHVGVGTRSQVQKVIKQKRVSVDGKIVNKPEVGIVAEEAVVEVNGERIIYKEFYYFILNKPAGVITATEDAKHETVLDLLDVVDQNKQVAPVGRLDKDTEGLLVLTNNGKMAHSLLSPKKHVDKKYYAKIEGRVTQEDCEAFANGIVLGDGLECMPAVLEIIKSDEESEIYVTIKEGKFHQVKRMFQAVGKKVTYLKRVQMGSFVLPEDLPLGAYRELTEAELVCLQTQPQNNQIEAVIFDLDGTLIDSMWVWTHIDEAYLGPLGIPVPDDMHQELEGMSFTETAHYFKNRFGLEHTVDEIKDSWNTIAQKMYDEDVLLKEHLLPFLDYLKSNNIKMGIATSNSIPLVKGILKRFDLDQYFDVIRTSCEVEKGKPHPDVYLSVADELKIDPKHCLVFEDIPNGVLAGKRAGMQVWAIEDRQDQTTQSKLKEMSDRYICDYQEALEQIKLILEPSC
ncbi:MAG: pseudouridine synthase [Cellulosilyticaceae bacterium]